MGGGSMQLGVKQIIIVYDLQMFLPPISLAI